MPKKRDIKCNIIGKLGAHLLVTGLEIRHFEEFDSVPRKSRTQGLVQNTIGLKYQ